MIHFLKTWPAEFDAVLEGRKTHEVRRCSDRTFAIGDDVVLREFVPQVGERGVETHPKTGQTLGRYTYRALLRRITYVTPGGSWGLPPEVCILSIAGRDSFIRGTTAFHFHPSPGFEEVGGS